MRGNSQWRDRLRGLKRMLRAYKHRMWKKMVSPFVQINKRPIFVLGNQKSGTTAVAALLALYGGRSATLDILHVPADILLKLHSGKLPVWDFVKQNKLDFSRAIIKEPWLTFFSSEIYRYFPASRVVMIVRDPRDNIRSILNRLELPGDLEVLGTSVLEACPPPWRLVLDSSWLGVSGNTYVEMLAARWNLAADAYLKNVDEMILIKYEEFIADKIGVIGSLAKRLSIPYVNDISSKIDFQFQPAGDHNGASESFFGQQNLRLINRTCDKRMKLLGYEL